jgi:hypothetical protein
VVSSWVITDVVSALKAIREEVRLIRTMLERK